MKLEARARIVAVKLLVGLLYPASSPSSRDWSREVLCAAFGVPERESDSFVFDHTGYYREISPRLMRCFFSFEGLRHPSGLAGWKKLAIELERRSGVECMEYAGYSGKRRVNIDPGYLDGARVVLASTKDNAHRIYLEDDIYAEVTLCHRKSGWERFSYTFPDFRSGQYDSFLDKVRRDWQNDVHNLKEGSCR